MPKRLEIRVTTPPDVYAATQAFGSELRVQLIRHFAYSPGRQIDAVHALGVERAVVSLNVRALIETGALLVEGENRRRLTFRVDHARIEHLVAVLRDFTAFD